MNIKRRLAILLLLCSTALARATVFNVDATMSEATIQSTVNTADATSGNTVAFACGNYTGWTQRLQLPAVHGTIYTGPANSAGVTYASNQAQQQTGGCPAILNSDNALTGYAILEIQGGNSANTTPGSGATVQNLTGFGELLLITGGTDSTNNPSYGILVQHNSCTNLAAGTGLSNTCYFSHNTTGITWFENYAGGVGSAYVNTGGFSVGQNNVNATADSNLIEHIGEGLGSDSDGLSGSTNVVIKNNICRDIARICIEITNGNSPGIVTGMLITGNLYIAPNGANISPLSGAFSMATGNNGNPGSSGFTFKDNDNTWIANTTFSGTHMFYCEEQTAGAASTALRNLCQGFWPNAPAIAIGNITGALDATNEIIEGSNITSFGQGFGCEYSGALPVCNFFTGSPGTGTVTSTGVTTSATTTQRTTTAPTILPASGAFASPPSVTFSNTQSNVSHFYTTNGTTPTTASTPYTGAFTCSSLPCTVKVLSQWGQGAAKAYPFPASYGWAPSSVATTTYTVSGSVSLTAVQPDYGFYMEQGSTRFIPVYPTGSGAATKLVNVSVTTGAATLSCTTNCINGVYVTPTSAGGTGSVTGTVGAYTLHSTSDVVVRFQSVDDNTKTVSVPIHVIDTSSSAFVDIEPVHNQAFAGQQKTLQSYVPGWDNNQNVTWAITSQPGGGNGVLSDVNATITNFSIASNVVTFAATNSYKAGEPVLISGLATGTYLNGQLLQITSASGTQFTAAFTHANVGSTTDSGTAKPTYRDVLFSATVPGTYTITAASVANPALTAAATVYVSSATPPGNFLSPNLTTRMPCDASDPAYTTIVEIGPTQTIHDLTTFNGLTWVAGTLVRLHNEDTSGIAPTTYHQWTVLEGMGTVAHPLGFCGVPDSAGNLPIMDGSGATTNAVNAGIVEGGGGFIIVNSGGSHFNEPYELGSVGPDYLNIWGIRMQNWNVTLANGTQNSYTSPTSHSSVNYTAGNPPAATYSRDGQHQHQEGMDEYNVGWSWIANNNTTSTGRTFAMFQQFMGGHINLFSQPNSFSLHALYLQGLYPLIEGNLIENPAQICSAGDCTNDFGDYLKIRGGGSIARYNFFRGYQFINHVIEYPDQEDASQFIGTDNIGAAMPLTSVAASSGGHAVYSGISGTNGTIGPGIPLNNLAGATVIISGFTNSANNGTFTVSASSGTVMTVNNTAAVAETPSWWLQPKAFIATCGFSIWCSITSNNITIPHMTMNTEAMARDWAYGNVMLNAGVVAQYGSGSAVSECANSGLNCSPFIDRLGRYFFFNNSVDQTTGAFNTLNVFSGGGFVGAPNYTQPTVLAQNNFFWSTLNPTVKSNMLSADAALTGVVDHNFFPTGMMNITSPIVPGTSAGWSGATSAFAYVGSPVNLNMDQHLTGSTTSSNFLNSSVQPYNPVTFVPNSGSPLIGAGSLPTDPDVVNMPVRFQPNYTGGVTARTAPTTIGAVESGATPALTACAISPASLAVPSADRNNRNFTLACTYGSLTRDNTFNALPWQATCPPGAVNTCFISFDSTNQTPAFGAFANGAGNVQATYSGTVWTTPYSIGGTPPAASPTALPVAGSYSSTQNVALSTITGGAAICFTTTGTAPAATVAGTCDAGSTTYITTITVASSLTIKALATLSGTANSAVASFAYVIGTPTVADPNCVPGSGTYSGTQTLTCSDTTSGATLCWTNTGTAPTAPTPGTCGAGSTTYAGSIPVTVSSTIKILGTKAGSTNSNVVPFTYTINPPAPNFTSIGGRTSNGGVSAK